MLAISAVLRRVATRIALCFALFAALVAGCDSPSPSAVDASVAAPDAQDSSEPPPPVAPTPPTPPTLPAPVRFDCPPNWVAVETPGGARRCNPWPGDGAPPDCGPGDAAFPGEPCLPIGSRCPAEGWPIDLPDSGVVYVRAGETGGIGTRERPFATIERGLAAARGGRTVAVAPGTYRENLDVTGTTVVGACASGVVVEAGNPDFATVGIAPDAVGTVRDVSLRAVTTPVGLLDRAELTLEDVVLEGAEEGALLQDGAVLHARRVLVDSPSDSGFVVWGDATLELARVVIRRPGAHAIATVRRPGATLSLQDVAIVDPGEAGLLASFVDGATITARRLYVTGAWVSGITVIGGTSDFEDVVVRRTREALQDEMLIGVGLLIEGGSASLRRVSVVEPSAGGLSTYGATIEADGLVVDGVAGVATGTEAIAVTGGALATLRGVHVERSAVRSALAVHASVMDVSDATLVALRPPMEERGGACLLYLAGSMGTVERVRCEAYGSVGLTVGGTGTVVRASDVSFSDVQPWGSFGYGVQVIEGGDVTLERASIVGATTIGMLVDSGTANVADLVIDGVASGEREDDFGIALLVDATGDDIGAAHVSLARAELSGAHRFGLLVYGADASLDAQDVVLDETAEAPCAASSCRGAAGGSAFACAASARLSARGFVASRSAFAGLLAVDGCRAELADGLVRANVFGYVSDATVSSDAFIGVRFEDNEVDFQTTSIEIEPPSAAPLNL